MADAIKVTDTYEKKGAGANYSRSNSPLRKTTAARPFTYRDYASWGEDVRCELINGEVYLMSAPTEWHQWVVVELCRQLGNWLEGKSCRVYIAPFDVRLFPKEDDGDFVVVQPDVFVVCDRSKLAGGKACKGAPDFVVEVLSEGSVKKDFAIKRSIYEKAGVKEYWIIDKDEVYTYRLAGGEGSKYDETVYQLTQELVISVAALSGCELRFAAIVDGLLPEAAPAEIPPDAPRPFPAPAASVPAAQ
jgi:Uma2 family endonuclease